MRSLLIAIAAGLLGAAILHIVIVLAIPHFARQRAWEKVQALGPQGAFHTVSPEAAPAILGEANSYRRSAICVFDANDAAIHIAADAGSTPFWSLAVFDPQANEIYSMNDRSAVEQRVDVTLATPRQLIAMRDSDTGIGAPATSIMVKLPQARGYSVLTTIAADPTWDDIANRFLAHASCNPVASP